MSGDGATGQGAEAEFLVDLTGIRIATSTAWPFRAYESRATGDCETETWVQIDLGASIRFDAVRVYPSNKFIMAGNCFPRRFRIECANAVDFSDAAVIADRSEKDYPDPRDEVLEFQWRGEAARFVRLIALRLSARKRPDIPLELPSAAPVYKLSLSKIEVISDGRDVAMLRDVTVDDFLGDQAEAQQLTRAPRPQGEGVVTDNPENVTSADSWRPVANRAETRGARVRLTGGLLRQAYDDNVAYLLSSFSVGDLLRQFHQRAGQPVACAHREPHPFWEEDLAGSNAGRFLMGAGAALLWEEHPELRARMDAVVAGIAGAAQADGYLMAYPQDTTLMSERGGYTRTWLTLGLLAAGRAGNDTAFQLLRKHYDWHNGAAFLPLLMRGANQGGQGAVATTQLYFSPVGKAEDLQIVQRHFQENYWLDDLSARKAEAVWLYPYDRPHCYLLTNIEAYLDLYRATGDTRYKSAIDGAWELFHDNWQNVGGSFSIIELVACPPKSHKLYAHMGETCGSAFWILLNHRLHLLNPDQERYSAEIERSIYNVLLANQDAANGVRYHAILTGKKEPATRTNTCCEGQGARVLADLAQYLYSTVENGLYVNQFAPSVIEWRHRDEPLRLRTETDFPRDGAVKIIVECAPKETMALRIRAPSWAGESFDMVLNGDRVGKANPGDYFVIERQWANDDRLEFAVPMQLRIERYTGVDQVNGHSRFALSYGPVLLAALDAADREILLLGAESAEGLIERLQRDPSGALAFSLDELSAKVRFVPYYEIGEESFSCFPLVETWPNIIP